jgi:hypothetical protein
LLMQRFILALVMGMFGGPGSGSGPVVPALAAQAPITLQAAAMETALAKAPVSPESAAAARRAVRHTRNGVEHRVEFPDGSVVEFSDRSHGSRDQAKRERVVAYVGTQRASVEPDSTFEAAGRTFGLSPEAVAALRFISRHEGGFDAINTWDRARFSWGFIQFAGGYGFPPALAHFKSSSPELFRKLLGEYGVDVLPGTGGPVPVYVDHQSGKVLRGEDAEQAYGDDPVVIALFIRAGRITEVKQRQVEAAIRDYAVPALSETTSGVRLSDVLRSPKGLAALIDRKVHEGNVIRLENALEHARITNNMQNPADWPRLEGLVLDLAVQDSEARANIVELVESAASGLARAAGAARGGDMAWVAGGPSLNGARGALQQALAEADYRMVVSRRRDSLRDGFATALMTTDPDRVGAMTAAGMAGELEAAAASVRELVSRMRFEYAIRNRLRGIRTSDLPGPA